MKIKTYEPTNQFQFVCPIFKATTKIASCIALRDIFWRGDRPEQRKGCQCVMESGKCPIPVVVSRITREQNDPYYSDTPKVGALEDDILDRIAPVLTMDKTINKHAMSEGERKLILKANEDARAGVRPERQPKRRAAVVKMDDVKETLSPAETDASELVKAAQSGDMSAAVNAAMEDHK